MLNWFNKCFVLTSLFFSFWLSFSQICYLHIKDLCDIWDEELSKVVKTNSLRDSNISLRDSNISLRDSNISLSESKTKLLLLLFALTSKLNLGISGIRLNNVPLECLELYAVTVIRILHKEFRSLVKMCDIF